MLDIVYIWIALAFIYLLASIFGEGTVRFGYVLIPFFGMMFWMAGWLPNVYMASTIPIAVAIGIITFLKEQYKIKFGAFGTNVSLIWKIMSFMIFLQFAIVFVSGLAAFNNNTEIASPNNAITNTYKLENAGVVYGNYTSIKSLDQISVGLTMVWSAYNLMFYMLTSVIFVIPNLEHVFMLDPSIALIIGAAFYIMLCIEIFILIYRPLKPPGL
jgi:hypothetical protein